MGKAIGKQTTKIPWLYGFVASSSVGGAWKSFRFQPALAAKRSEVLSPNSMYQAPVMCVKSLGRAQPLYPVLKHGFGAREKDLLSWDFSHSLVTLMSGFETALWQPHPPLGSFAVIKSPICFT